MKGVVLCGGTGSRLGDLTKVTNKHLLPIYNKPMVYYPLETLAKAGIKEVMVVVSGPYSGNFIPLLKNGEQFGFNRLVYGYQEKQDGGIADALNVARDFAENESITVILGDNVTDADISKDVNDFAKTVDEDHSFQGSDPRAKIFIKKVPDPSRYGVPEFKTLYRRGIKLNSKIKRIIEKPKNPPSNYAVTGLYMYDSEVFNFIDQISPSERGELEITDINNMYINDEFGKLDYNILNGYWQDAGTFDSLYEANKYWYEKNK